MAAQLARRGRGDERLRSALGVTKRACSVYAALAHALSLVERDERRASRHVTDAAASLIARARQAPSLAATWGPSGLITFYASKAARALDDTGAQGAEEARAVTAFMLDREESSCYLALSCRLHEALGGRKGRRIDSTGFGYIVYTLAFERFLLDQGVLDQRKLCEHDPTGCHIGLINALDALVEAAAEGRVKPAIALYAAETLSRLVTIYFTPVVEEAKSRPETGLKVFIDMCKE